MGTFLKFDISIYATFLLIALLITMDLRKGIVNTSNKLLKRVAIITIIMLWLEILSWQFDGKPGKFNWYANYITNMIYSVSVTSIACAWLSYIDYQVYRSYSRIKQRWFYIHPLILNVILIIINLFVPIIFSVSESNIYSRESFIWLQVVIALCAYIYSIVLVFGKNNVLRKEVVAVLVAYFLMPTIAAVIQMFVYGAFILWPMVAGTVILAYIFLETVSSSKDYLTGLTLRHIIDDHIEYLLENNIDFTLVVLNLDKFKYINDKYGHMNGDRALIVFSNSLTKVFNDVGIIARYAGDEFVIVVKKINEDKLITKLKKLEAVLAEKIKKEGLGFDLQFSFGYKKNDVGKRLNYQTVFEAADKNMYDNKVKKKSQKQHNV